jgi:hypothetical protein
LKSMAYSLKSEKIISVARFVGFKRVTSIEDAEKQRCASRRDVFLRARRGV